MEGEDDCKRVSFNNKVIPTVVYFLIKLTNQLRIVNRITRVDAI
jgi:hypothetical protein